MSEQSLDVLIGKIEEINRKLGQKTIGYANEFQILGKIPTGSVSLDHALRGGWPLGRIVLLWGNRSCGKTTLSLRAIAEAQKEGRKCLFIDAEKAFDPTWAQKLGVDTDRLLVMRRNNVEDILDATKSLLKDEIVDVVVLDSINNINSVAFFDEGNSSIGQNARALGGLLSKWNAWNVSALIILISQARNKFAGTMVYADHGGGLAAEHYPSVIVKLLSSRDKTSFLYDTIKRADGSTTNVQVGQMIKWEVTKSKVSPPFLSGQFPLFSDGRRDDSYELASLAISFGIIQKTGAWYRFNEYKWQGEENVRNALRNDHALATTVRDKVMSFEIFTQDRQED